MLKTVTGTAIGLATAPEPEARWGMVAHDFALRTRGPALILAAPARMPPGLFPDATLVPPGRPADARIGAPHGKGVPGLRLRPALMRPPPVRGRATHPASITLADASGTSWATHLLARDGWFTPDMQARATSVLHRWTAARVGGTWWGAPPARSAAGCAVVFAADLNTTRRLLAAALARSGAARTILVAERAAPWTALCRRLGVTLLSRTIDPWPLIEEAASLHASPDSEPAQIARLLGKPLDSAAPQPDPVRAAAALLILGVRYVDPFTGAPESCEAVLDRAAEWRRQSGEASGIACCVGISFWKRRRMAEMLGAHRAPAFRRTAAASLAVAAKRGGSIAVWASRAPPGLAAGAAAQGTKVLRIEDGFIRSVGLGADFLPPLSIVLDASGLYYDATGPSDLEAILADSRFAPGLLARAAALRRRLVEAGVTKYNLSGAVPDLQAPPGRRVILVPGQVADDRSVLLGGGGARPGLPLLQAVRAHAPDAFIVYKPHPDVDAGHRAGAIPEHEALSVADRIVRGGSMDALLDRVDEVHTLTSLTGFEALLRGRPVTTYGQPFYAGWGLSEDRNPPARRGRRLSLDELVAGALILYPRYIDPISLLPCGPETVLDRLADPTKLAALHNIGLLVRARRLQGRLLSQIATRLRQKTMPVRGTPDP